MARKSTKKNTTTPEVSTVFDILMAKTQDFHDKHIARVKSYAAHVFDEAVQLKDFVTEDFMSFFGVMNDSDGLKYARYQVSGRGAAVVRDYYFKMCCPFFVEYQSDKKPVNIGGKVFEAAKVRAIDHDVHSYSARLMNIKSDEEKAQVPGVFACQMIQFKNSVAIESANPDTKSKWDKQYYIARQVDAAESKYKADMLAIAEKIVKTNININKMNVTSQYPDAKHYDITLTDGVINIHARSIFAAEFSTLVSPHYRFIMTMKNKNK